MEVAFVGRTKTLSEPVRHVVEVKLAHLSRLTPVLERAEVRFTEDPRQPSDRRRVCEVRLTGHGHTVRASAGGRDEPSAVDLVVDKLEHQVERLKGKLVGRSHPRRVPVEGGGVPDAE